MLATRTCVPLAVVVVGAVALWFHAPDRDAPPVPEPVIEPVIVPLLLPSSPPAGAVSLPCVDEDSTLHAVGEDAVVCSGSACMDVLRQRITPIRKEPPATSGIHHDDHQLCRGLTCRPIGHRLHDALDADGVSDAALDATADLAAVIVDNQAWSVARDRPLHLIDDRSSQLVEQGPIRVAGNVLVANTFSCGWGCGFASVVDSAGRTRTPSLDINARVAALGSDLFALLADSGMLYVLDGRTGAITGQLALGAFPVWQGGQLVQLDSWQPERKMMAILRTGIGNQMAEVVFVGVDARVPWLVEERFMPICH